MVSECLQILFGTSYTCVQVFLQAAISFLPAVCLPALELCLRAILWAQSHLLTWLWGCPPHPRSCRDYLVLGAAHSLVAQCLGSPREPHRPDNMPLWPRVSIKSHWAIGLKGGHATLFLLFCAGMHRAQSFLPQREIKSQTVHKCQKLWLHVCACFQKRCVVVK